MAKSNDAARRKMVWRISERNPKGEWVDASADARPAANDEGTAAPEITFGGWVMSSFDLLKGLEVSDGHGTVPADLFDELFPQRPDGAEPPPER